MPEPKHALETGEKISTIYDSVYEQMHTDHARNLLKLERKLGLPFNSSVSSHLYTNSCSRKKKSCRVSKNEMNTTEEQRIQPAKEKLRSQKAIKPG